MRSFVELTGIQGRDSTKTAKFSMRTVLIDGVLETENWTTIYSSRLGEFDVLESHDEVMRRIEESRRISSNFFAENELS